MIKEAVLNRILYVGTWLVIGVVFILVMIVIPLLQPDKPFWATPDKTVSVFWAIVLIHMLLAVGLIYSSIVRQRGGRISKDLIVAVGIVLIIFGLTMSDGAFAYLGESGAGRRMVAISMFICVGFDFIAGVLIFIIARYSQRLKHLFNSR